MDRQRQIAKAAGFVGAMWFVWGLGILLTVRRDRPLSVAWTCFGAFLFLLSINARV